MHLMLLSGAMYRLKLLSLEFSCTLRLDKTYATGILHVFNRLMKTMHVTAFGAAVRGTVWGRIAVSGIFSSMSIW